MATPPNASTTDTTAIAAHAAAQAAANASFIDTLTPMIATAAAKGEFWVTALTYEPMNLHDLAVTLRGLGYLVAFIDNRPTDFQPAELFGEAWEAFWAGGQGFIPDNLKNPTRVRVGWKNT